MKLKKVFMMLILGLESLGGLVPRRVRGPRRGKKKYSTLWVQFQWNRIYCTYTAFGNQKRTVIMKYSGKKIKLGILGWSA